MFLESYTELLPAIWRRCPMSPWKVPGKPYFPLLAVVNERKKEMGVAV